MSRGASYEEDFSDVNLTDEQLATINSLDCSNMNIKDVSGVEKLTHLRSFNIENNQIDRMNLSNNKLLYDLNYAGNKFSCIDISKNYYFIYRILMDYDSEFINFDTMELQERVAAGPESFTEYLDSMDDEELFEMYDEMGNEFKHMMVDYGEEFNELLAAYKNDSGIQLIVDSKNGNSCVYQEENVNNNQNTNKAQIVKVPSTGLNAGIIFTVVGVAIILVAGIVIWVFVKDKKSKK